LLPALIRLARPLDWIKNVFVVLPLPFAVAGGAHFEAVSFLLGLAGFCLVNSAVYVLNDLCDAPADRLHPRKCNRPIAAGVVPPLLAGIQIALLFPAGMALCVSAGKPGTAALVGLYIVLNLAYCLGAKHVALLDVFLLSAGFVIRVILGCVLVGAQPSGWLLLCTSALALFLGFVKRRADLTEGLDPGHRPSLHGYSMAFLDQAMTVSASLAMLSYALYCIEAKDTVLTPGRELASMPFVLYGILNYLRMAYLDNAGGSPVHAVLRSRTTQLCALGWLIAILWGLKR
jgi:4-hydroxybenzoate polyprenyltransferase